MARPEATIMSTPRGVHWPLSLRRAARALAFSVLALLPAAVLLSAPPFKAVVLTLDGAVSPATADYAVRGIRKAAEQNAALVILRMDTPGGLDTSMRQIIREI
ncbi:MAG TPA: nodulation protein NfeD, partial [Burkholderiales bacterium]|nr:nodulation protein NfeD [Burkholderiales bacterium]